MSRRGGKRRQVLQLGNGSSKLHRYGYSKNFQSGETAKESSLKLIGAYSDSEPEENAEELEFPEDSTAEGKQSHDFHNEESQEGGEDEDAPNMDDELRNFLSEIEAIPMPPEAVSNSNSKQASPTHQDDQQSEASPDHLAEQDDASQHSDHSAVSETSAKPESSKKKYSMFVKGEVQFTNSPGQDESAKDKPAQEKAEEIGLPEEPVSMWQMVPDEATQYYYYWNWQTNEVTWEIPSDYTQYLLLHREYEEKLTKLTPAQLAVLQEKKSRENASESEKTSKMDGPANSSTVQADRKFASTVSSNIEGSHSSSVERSLSPHNPTGADDSHRRREKKKKSHKHKKHKRRHSDDDLDEMDDDDNKKQSVASDASVVTLIGPRLPFIVPYLSDNDDEEEEDKEPEENSKSVAKSEKTKENWPEPNIADNVVAVIEQEVPGPAAPDYSPSPDVSDQTEKHSRLADDLEADVDSLLGQDRIDTGEMQNETQSEPDVLSEDVCLTKEIDGEKRERHLVENIESEKAHSETSQDSVEMKIQEDFENCDAVSQSTSVDAKPKKLKKEVIDMFSEDFLESKSVLSADDDNEENLPPARLLPEELAPVVSDQVEDGEIPDTLGNLSDPGSKSSLVPAYTAEVEETAVVTTQYTGSLSVPEILANEPKDKASPLVNIVGYGSDEDEEEGEVKEEEEVGIEKDKPGRGEERQGDRKRRDSRDAGSSHHKASKRTEEHRKSEADKRKEEKYGSHAKSAKRSKSSREEKTGRDSRVKLPRDSSGKDRKDHRSKKPKLAEDVLGTDSQPSQKNTETVGRSQVENSVSERVGRKSAVSDRNEVDDVDIDFDDLDDIDRVLDMAMTKKMDKKKVVKEVDTHDIPHTHSVDKEKTDATSLESREEAVVTSNLKEDSLSLTNELKDSTDLILTKLEFLDITVESFSKLQVLCIELKTRYIDWTASELTTSYFRSQLQQAEGVLAQYEQSAVPAGWARQWDRDGFVCAWSNLPAVTLQDNACGRMHLLVVETNLFS